MSEEQQEQRTAITDPFEKGYAAGWAIQISEAFRETFGIRLDAAAGTGKNGPKRCTVGTRTFFTSGDLFFDDPRAHGTGKWSETISRLAIAVQVTRAKKREDGSNPEHQPIEFCVLRPKFGRLASITTYQLEPRALVHLLEHGVARGANGTLVDLRPLMEATHAGRDTKPGAASKRKAA